MATAPAGRQGLKLVNFFTPDGYYRLLDESIMDGGNSTVSIGFINDHADLDLLVEIIWMLMFWL